MQVIAHYKHDTAENILWHSEEEALYWVDIPRGELYRGHFIQEQFMSSCVLKLEEPIGGFVFCEDGGLLLFAAEGRIYHWAYQREAIHLVSQAPRKWVSHRFNDVLALPNGDVLCTTMPSDSGSDSRLLLFHPKEQEFELIMDGLKLGNGMGISPDLRWVYLADTRDYRVYRFELDSNTCKLGQARCFIAFEGRPGRPDGLTVDAQGLIWLAETGAAQLACFSPEDGRELGTISAPAEKPTSLCFGGANCDRIFVSSQGGPNAAELSGAIFMEKWEEGNFKPSTQGRAAQGSEVITCYRGKSEYSSSLPS